jgi:biopolymer transport protein ExbB
MRLRPACQIKYYDARLDNCREDDVLELIQAGGWLMLPIIACSIIALTIIIERLWTLRRSRVLPAALIKALRNATQGTFALDNPDSRRIMKSPLGRIVTVALVNRARGRDVVKQSIEDTGRHVVHEMERYLNMLGTIAAITPLLGLLGTVFGMIRVFTVISVQGSSNTEMLAGGISTALITTAAGLTVAIPSLLFYRYLRSKIDELVINMEQEAIRLVDVMLNNSESAVSNKEVS